MSAARKAKLGGTGIAFPPALASRCFKKEAALHRNAGSQCGLMSALKRVQPEPATPARLSPRTPTPPHNSKMRVCSACCSRCVLYAHLTSRTMCSKVSKFGCLKAAGPNSKLRPSMVSATFAGPCRCNQAPPPPSTPTPPPAAMPPAAAAAPTGGSVRAKIAPSRSCDPRKCAQRECHKPLPESECHRRSAKADASGTSSARCPFQTATSCTRAVARSTVSWRYLRAAGDCGPGSSCS
mmetsp:Transcript_24781/g.65491  ORF Transcript_24781/g.65491 Transcript_24781/m.65491 type:complete len:238 (+) Transcript_24781:324-1037(+)